MTKKAGDFILPATLPPKFRPQEYIASPELKKAVQSALTLGLPFLVTGDPGVGKTQLAYYVGNELRVPVYRFNARSSTCYQDLFYSFDHIGHFRAAQLRAEGETIEPTSFVTFNALGKAILRSWGRDGEGRPRELSLWNSECGTEPVRSLVLIDEIDKAPRDFPNDLLAAFEDAPSFEMTELPHRVKLEANPACSPIIFLTSNAESLLPSPFLRRCAYFHIPLPEKEELKAMVSTRLERLDRLDKALDFFIGLRERGLVRIPSTGEFMVWLHEVDSPDWSWAVERLSASLGLLVKAKEDMPPSLEWVREFVDS
ncbi:MAG: AAA family ATPase [Vulcanimicrobiota bacterium]